MSIQVLNSSGGGSGTTINPTNSVIPVRSNATTFIDSHLSDNGTTITASEPISGTIFNASGLVRVGFLTGFPTFGAVWMGSGAVTTPLDNNTILNSDGAQTTLTGSTSVQMTRPGGIGLVVNSTGCVFNSTPVPVSTNSVNFGSTSLKWANAYFASAVQATLFTCGTSFGVNALQLYDGGGGVRYGAGINASEMQFFVPTSAHMTWNGGGDLNATTVNEWMRLTSSGLSLPGTVTATTGMIMGNLTATGTINILSTSGSIVVPQIVASVNSQIGATPLVSSFAVMPGTGSRNNFTGAIGMRFTVTTPIQVSRLGRKYLAGNSQDHVIKIWAVTGPVQLAAGTVLNASASDANGFKWVNISTITLLPGISYAIAVDENNAGDTWIDEWAPTLQSYIVSSADCYTAAQGGYPNTINNSGNLIFSTPAMWHNLSSATMEGAGTTADSTAYALQLWDVNGSPLFSVRNDGLTTGIIINATSAFQANGVAGVSAGPFTVISSITTSEGIVTALSGTSDERLKNAQPYTDGLNTILAINPVRYMWNDAGQKHTGLSGTQEFIGFIAQNIQRAIPEAITATEGDEKYLSLDDRPIIAALVNAVKELNAEIKELYAIIQVQNERIKVLESEVRR